MQSNPQVPWTEEQWARVNQAIQEEAQRARVAANFPAAVRPLAGRHRFRPQGGRCPEAGPLEVNDKHNNRAIDAAGKGRSCAARSLPTPSWAASCRYSAAPPTSSPGWKTRWSLTGRHGRGSNRGGPRGRDLADDHGAPGLITDAVAGTPPVTDGNELVAAVANAIGYLETNGHFGPFAVVLSQQLFRISQQPNPDRPQVTPQHQIIPLLGGGSLLRSLGDPPMGTASSWRLVESPSIWSSPRICRFSSCN